MENDNQIKNWVPADMLEVTLNEPDDFLKIRETLTRIGVASRKDNKPAKTKARRISFDKYLSLLDAQTDIGQDIKDKAREMAQTLRDMEQEAEPEGGKVADRYGSIMMKQEKEYAKLKAKKAKIDARVEKYKMM